MSKIFLNKNAQSPLSPRQSLQAKYVAGRSNLLFVVIFSLVNVFLLLTGSDTYFLFSATIPYYLVIIGMDLCGKFPPEYYEGREDFTPLDSSVLVVLAVIAVVMIALYLLCWLLSSKGRVAWLIVALVLFGTDTALMFLLQGFSLESILDILFHAWVLYYLIVGVTAHFKLKKLPPEEELPATDPAFAPVEEQLAETDTPANNDQEN